MKYILTLLILLPLLLDAQIRGRVLDANGEAIEGATVSIENSYSATSTNAQGDYELKVNTPATYQINVYHIGFQTERRSTQVATFPFTIDFTLKPLEEEIEEVVIQVQDNPANRIMRQAIAQKKNNSNRYSAYTVDFYSKGAFKLLKLPERIAGIKIDSASKADILDEVLADSTEQGFLYLSETMSEVAFQKPNKLSEHIKASKVSGDDRGYSFNTALTANFDFYRNYIPLVKDVISPLADQAFSYYTYQLIRRFESDGRTIFQIRMTPKRTTEPTFSGDIYIVNDTFEVYAVDVKTTGKQLHQELLDTIRLQQQYVYHRGDNLWIKQSQIIHLNFNIFSIALGGKFEHILSNYNFAPDFDKKTFGSTVVRIDKESNAMSDDFWEKNRPVVLQQEEQKNYVQRDSVQSVRNSPAYKDSVDREHNIFQAKHIISGYSYQNSTAGYRVGYRMLDKIQFNSVQGLVLGMSGFYNHSTPSKLGNTRVEAALSYGFSDRTPRANVRIDRQFDHKRKKRLSLYMGSDLNQFNPQAPIHPIINSIATLFFGDNYIRLYQRDYVGASYEERFAASIHGRVSFFYKRRSAVDNKSDYRLLRRDDIFQSNHQFDHPHIENTPFHTHSMAKLNAEITWTPGQRIIDRPDGYFFLRAKNYPKVLLRYEQGFSSAQGFQALHGQLSQAIDLKNKGILEYVISGGNHFKTGTMSFIDYKHFNGNQTHVMTTDQRLHSFRTLPYYTFSTDGSYLESHLEYNLNGYLFNKVPALGNLGLHEIVGHHHLTIPGRGSYQELTFGIDRIGWGKFRPFRFDYIRFFQGSHQGNGWIVGINLPLRGRQL